MSLNRHVSNNSSSTLAFDWTQDDARSPDLGTASVCPVCGAMTESRRIGTRAGWTCIVGGYAHYYQAQYGHLKRWFTSGEGNLREPVIQAMNCAA